ncbi:MarR family transcriptional regulator [Streptomyces sp. Je 1-4]|uniref:MarR family winged helix-turn-helix transcriptional regulator n=1 Tax=Streptomyces TaxID=1883 RepID=UPI00140ED42D|nr:MULTISPECIES: MarR family transcriptional regulator [unclassified Streptomyces]QIK08174.1 MarR family transcriptional regulator [Streptomyces sp. ID38640]UYB41801.1 MarR family transcriptional regulator [Streptomyces sp. Je 1-4]UZQ38065.1 MarR family transcriptional regulator [Streptomyces sp. Je 1-4] [Streptomyces sp. Je 1-4 4N24]UZQ45482.1 MarR family transcriptional regulator [Streptomyces sp. Je 1-4] [Streptomyces sp. Je 1-4 4N24_ara]
MEEPVSGGVGARRERLAGGLRNYGASFTELGRRFAARIGVHSTDAFALLEIASAEERGTPLSPASLGRRIPLSSGAMTALLNRLEEAGYVTRTRGHADRRIVTLHSSPRVGELADEFFGPANARQDAVLSRYPAELLEQFETLLSELSSAMEDGPDSP